MDLLGLGDRSPGELRAELGIASNLLAHHLGVLEVAGVIGRTRSEGDRRRSYVHLREGALADLIPRPVLRARRIMFVCTGNSARSPLAAALWGAISPIPATSAGTHPAEQTAARAITIAARHGLDIAGHVPRRIEQPPVKDDVVITLCDRAREELGAVSALHWSVANPGRVGTPQAYETAFQEIAHRIETLVPSVRAPT